MLSVLSVQNAFVLQPEKFRIIKKTEMTSITIFNITLKLIGIFKCHFQK